MRIAVIGAGNIGATLALVRAHEHDVTVTILHRIGSLASVSLALAAVPGTLEDRFRRRKGQSANRYDLNRDEVDELTAAVRRTDATP